MDPTLYTAATKADIVFLRGYKDQVLNQVTSHTGNTVLHVIAQYNDSADAIQEILSDQDYTLVEKLLTWKNTEGETALFIASRNRRVQVVQCLLKSAREVEPRLGDGEGIVSLIQRMVRMANKNGDTPLHEAVNNKHEVIVKLLVCEDPKYEHLPNNMGKTPLYVALEKRVNTANPVLRLFYYMDGSIDGLVSSYDPTLRAIFDVCKTPGPGTKGPEGETILHAAARWKETSKWITEICKRIPDTTKKQDNRKFSPLHYAAYFNNHSAVKHLLEADKSMADTTADEDKHDSMTPLHIAASKGHTEVIKEILKNCQYCWDRFTSKGQNILHLAAQGQHNKTISFIIEQPWAINLLNMKDIDGNTPSHLLLSSMPKRYKAIKPLLKDPNVYLDALNNQHSTPMELFNKEEIQLTAKKVRILHELHRDFGIVEKIPWRIDDGVNGNSKKEVGKTQRLEEMKKTAETHLLVATLIATVTFAAGFTLPGGYEDKHGPTQGMAVLITKSAFKAFVVTDTVAVISSLAAIFLHFTATLYKSDEEKISNRYSVSLLFLIIAMISMSITFVTGLYVVLEKSPAIAITVGIIGCSGILLLLYLIRKVYHDMGVKFLADQYFFALIFFVLPFAMLYYIIMGIVNIFKCLGYILRKVRAIFECIVVHYPYVRQDLDFHRIP